MASGDDDDREVYVSIVALAISLIALSATVLQVLQTYIASSAAGYARCGVKVMGEWGRFTNRKFKLYDLRFEVEFETPVIFLAPPTNPRGPIANEPIWYANGSPESYKETRTLLPQDAKEQRESQSQKQLVHTADNERASWVELLAAVQKMESESDEWQRRLYFSCPGKTVPPKFDERTLAVAIQKKTKSWDTMPASMTKPYATTTMCHLIELAAVLGLHWKEFSRSLERYRAEGNGYILTGAPVGDLGLVFTFQRTGRTTFAENRVIPVDDIKRLCFGAVPTIFCRTAEHEERLKFPFDQPEDLTTLQLSSAREIADTLMVIGCNTNTANCFLEEDKRTTHLFPVAFEVLGMLGRTLHASGSAFRMLPNPTIYHWEKKSFSMWKILEAYQEEIEKVDGFEDNEQVMKIKKNLDHIMDARRYRKDLEFSVPTLDALHQSLDDVDNYLTNKVQDYLVVGVLRAHFERVLHLINDISEEAHFNALNNATPEERQADFVGIYFRDVRESVVRNAPRRRFTTLNGDSTALVPFTSHLSKEDEDRDEDAPRPMMRQPTAMDGEKSVMQHTIWFSLVFRMLCWLLLHDFHKNDVQITKSELLGSRLPVYIV